MIKERNEALFARYIQILKRHGKYATKIDKSSMYEEAAMPFFIQKEYAGRIIRRMLGDKKRRVGIETDPEIKEILLEMDKMIA